MSNKTVGNGFEQELCDILSQHGFWVHPLNANRSGQPADIIAARNKVAYLIDAKVCSSRGFTLSRMEENQDLAMSLWNSSGNGQGWFALKLPNEEIYMIPHICVQAFRQSRSSFSFHDIHTLGKPLGKWVEKCK